jgi:hypothetical protein
MVTNLISRLFSTTTKQELHCDKEITFDAAESLSKTVAKYIVSNNPRNLCTAIEYLAGREFYPNLLILLMGTNYQKLGYLAESMLGIMQKHNIDRNNKSLVYIINAYTGNYPRIPLIERDPLFSEDEYDFIGTETSPIMEKWGIDTPLNEEKILHHISIGTYGEKYIEKYLAQHIVDVLKSENVRDYCNIFETLAKGKYDAALLVKLAQQKNVYQKLGFLADTILKIANSRNLQGYFACDKLTNIVSYYAPFEKEMTLVENIGKLLYRYGKETENDLKRKWNIVTCLDEEEIYYDLTVSMLELPSR